MKWAVSVCAAMALVVLADLAKETDAKKIPRINGGQEASEGQYPTYVMILGNGRQSCGGTLIAGNLVLTAAHCLNDSNIEDLTVARGNITYDVEGDTLISADEMSDAKEKFVHPDYEKSDGNDIGILMLRQNLSPPFAVLSRPGSSLAVGTITQAIGFGRNSEFVSMIQDEDGDIDFLGESPSRLYEVNLTVGKAGVPPCPKAQDNPSSGTWIDEQNVYEEKEFCLIGNFFYTNLTDAGVGIASACSGDSGGPVFYESVQYGVTGRVLNTILCENLFIDPFTIYTKVSAHRKDFIDPIMKKYGK